MITNDYIYSDEVYVGGGQVIHLEFKNLLKQ